MLICAEEILNIIIIIIIINNGVHEKVIPRLGVSYSIENKLDNRICH